MSTPRDLPMKPLVIAPTQRRHYDMGRMKAAFLADGTETSGRHAISEWWLEPRTPGPGPHSHPEEHIYYVLAGTLALFIDGEWTAAARGSCAVIPGGTVHDFQNRGDDACGFLNINTPGGFEEDMPDIVEWFQANPLGEVEAG